ncbi:MAG: beta-mannanase [Chthoniobacterales bacterium]|nr:beta-mannanase [Chthoniobacterales bacterium]
MKSFVLHGALPVLLVCAAGVRAEQEIVAPPPGKLYQGFFYSAPLPGSDDASEHNVAPADVAAFETAIGRKTAWIYFSDNWFESRAFPADTCAWIHSLGKVPYVRLMLRSDLDQRHAEKTFSLTNIIAGEFDDDLRRWAISAKAFAHPILIEWGTEPNGQWFAWNGRWNGRAAGPARYVAAYRHIVDLMRDAEADNLQWIWHVNWDDDPERNWNRLENYFPGENYCDWLAVSAYGALTPRAADRPGSFREELDAAYPRLTKLAPGKPIIVAEFGGDVHYPKVPAAIWAHAALEDLFSGRWPAVIGFCWWNETWENDDIAAHNSDLNILHDPALTSVFREALAKHAALLQTSPIVRQP